MTVSSTVRLAGPFVGTGLVSAYAFNYKVFDDSDVVVQVVDATGLTIAQTLGSTYSVAVNPDQDYAPGGTVNLFAPLALGYVLTLGSSLPLTQETNFTDAGGFLPGIVEDGLDRAIILIQQALSQLSGALRFPEIGAVPALPDASSRAGKLLGFDNAGNPIPITAAAQSATALAIALLSSSNGSGVDLVAGGGRVVSSIAAVRALRKTDSGKAYALAYNAGGTTGGGQYWYNAADTTSADNGGTIIVAADGGRWYLADKTPISIEHFGVVGSTFNSSGVVVPGNDTSTIPTAISGVVASGLRKVHLTNGAGYKTNSTVAQPYNISLEGVRQEIYCDGISPGSGTPAWRLTYSPWADNTERFHMRVPLRGVLLRGNANAADGVYTANLHGLQFESYHQVVREVTCDGFDRAFTFAPSTGAYTGWLCWETKLYDCVGFYSNFGLYADFSSATGQSGAGITMQGGSLGHNNYSVYNNAGELTFIDVASDAPLVAHILDNITQVTGNEIGFMHWQNSRFEAGGTPGTPWITNSGIARFNNCFFVERNGAEYIFNTNAGGHTIVEGGLWRSADGRYKATGAGVISQRGLRPINDSNGVFFNASNSGILNNDFAGGTTNGWATTLGTVTLSNIADAGMLFAGRSLNMLASAFSGGNATVASATIALDRTYSEYTLCFKASNANASGITVTVREFNITGSQITSYTTNIPAGAAALPLAIKGVRIPDADYLTIEIAFVTGQTSAVRVSDFYLTQW